MNSINITHEGQFYVVWIDDKPWCTTNETIDGLKLVTAVAILEAKRCTK